MIIRNYLDDDLDTCRELWVKLTEAHRQIYDAPSIGGDSPGLRFDEQLGRVGPERIWVAEDADTIVGMIGLQPGSEEGSLEVEPLVVAPEARSGGVGTALIQHVIEVVKGMGLRDLNVRVVGRNAEAIRFYHDIGFDVIGYIELLYDTSPRQEQIWREQETIAGRDFRV